MTVKELVEALSRYPEDTKVYFEQASHDYWRTMLALSVDEMELGHLKWSSYHEEMKIVDEDDADDKDDGLAFYGEEVLILK